MRLLQIEGLRLIQLGRGSPRASLRCADAREGTHGSTRWDGDLDVFGAAGDHAFGETGDLNTLGDIVVG